MSENVVSVLTFKSVGRILETGGTQSWRLQPDRVAKCKYAVVCRNASTREAEGPEVHKTAFMVGKVRGVVPSTDHDGRWLILFSEYAECSAPDQWEGRYPVTYLTTDDYPAIDFDRLNFLPMPSNERAAPIALPGSISLDLPPALAKWTASQVSAGNFSDESDYVRHLIRRDGERANWQAV